ncbi:hypothetical protein NDU88_005418 [Pleurodeles waltl]|uniref:Uncharacterized protein n=1 Tax=Pleurodeles waltl TaxID=8319 RepID=A0AAV7W7R7_PLEWA|nr:hypothetical protein NDU88_005418 [Pleurodeles waltl]
MGWTEPARTIHLHVLPLHAVTRNQGGVARSRREGGRTRRLAPGIRGEEVLDGEVSEEQGGGAYEDAVESTTGWRTGETREPFVPIGDGRTGETREPFVPIGDGRTGETREPFVPIGDWRTSIRKEECSSLPRF